MNECVFYGDVNKIYMKFSHNLIQLFPFKMICWLQTDVCEYLIRRYSKKLNLYALISSFFWVFFINFCALSLYTQQGCLIVGTQVLKKYFGKRCLSVVVCNASTTYTSSFRSLKYLLKIPYFIQDYPNVAGFLIFVTLCLGRAKTLTYVWKNIIKMNGICVWYHISSQ